VNKTLADNVLQVTNKVRANLTKTLIRKLVPRIYIALDGFL